MNLRHRICLLVTGLAISISLAACGGGEVDGNPSPTRVQPTAEQLAAFESERRVGGSAAFQSEAPDNSLSRDQPNNFDFCARDNPQGANSDSFSVNLAKDAVLKLGTIPVGVKGLQIKLQATNDLDIRLIRSSDQFQYVGWPNGALSWSTLGALQRDGMNIRYSGYNGDGTGKGNEWIEVDETTKELQMDVFAFQAGSALVTYKWTSATGAGSCTAIATKGSKAFSSTILQGKRVLVGEIPEGVANLVVALDAENDLDIQLVEKGTSAEIVNWQSGSFLNKHSFHYVPELNMSYSGYNGDGRGMGYEYLRIEGKTKKAYLLYAYGYRAGTATVRYSWDDSAARRNFLALLRDTQPGRVMATTVCPVGSPTAFCAPYGFWSHVALLTGTGALEMRVIHSHPDDNGVSRAVYDLKRLTGGGQESPRIGIFAPNDEANFSASAAIAKATGELGRPYVKYLPYLQLYVCTDLVRASYAAGGAYITGYAPDTLVGSLKSLSATLLDKGVYQ